jgi:hypothetical protein
MAREVFEISINKENFIYNNILCSIIAGKYYMNGNLVDEKVYNAKYNYAIKELKDFLKKYGYE